MPLGLAKDIALKMADKVGLQDKRDLTAEILLKMYDLFLKKDALLIEINPYAEDQAGNCTYILFLHYLIYKIYLCICYSECTL